MRKAVVKIHDKTAGVLTEKNAGEFSFKYLAEYNGPPVSLTMPVEQKYYEYNQFPPFFDGLLPEGIQLESLLKKYKIDKRDCFRQLVSTGADLVGAVTVEEIVDE